MPLAEVLNIGVKIASAVETVHRAGLLHRDIKPSNILVTGFGSPVLSDFGIVASRTHTRDNTFAMSVPWSAAEVLNEQTSGTVASEIWSLGATIYSLLAGRTPFERAGKGQNTREQLKARISQAKYTPIGRGDVPQRLEQVLAQSMNRKPDQRQRSAAQFAQDLQQVQHELGLAVTPLEIGEESWTIGGGQVNFANEQVRGPIRAQVAVESQRKRKQPADSSSLAQRDEQIVEAARGGVPKPFWWILSASVVAVAATVILVLTGVL